MSSVANQLRHPFRLFIAIALLLMLPLIGTAPRAVALDEHAHHEQRMPIDLDCAAACAQATNTAPPKAILSKVETRTPDPKWLEIMPYHMRPQAIPAPKKLRPAAMYGSVPSRPPDIIKLSGHFLS